MKIVVRTRFDRIIFDEWNGKGCQKEWKRIEETIMHNCLYRWHCKSQNQFAYKINELKFQLYFGGSVQCNGKIQ